MRAGGGEGAGEKRPESGCEGRKMGLTVGKVTMPTPQWRSKSSIGL